MKKEPEGGWSGGLKKEERKKDKGTHWEGWKEGTKPCDPGGRDCGIIVKVTEVLGKLLELS